MGGPYFPFRVIIASEYELLVTSAESELLQLSGYLLGLGFEASVHGDVVMVDGHWKRVFAALSNYPGNLFQC